MIQQGEASDAEDAQKIIKQGVVQALKAMIDEMIQQGEASDAEDAQKIIEQWLDQALKAMIDEMIQQGEAGIPPGCILAPAPDSEIKDSRAKTNFQPCQNFILKLAGYKSIIACLEALEREQQK